MVFGGLLAVRERVGGVTAAAQEGFRGQSWQGGNVPVKAPGAGMFEKPPGAGRR